MAERENWLEVDYFDRRLAVAAKERKQDHFERMRDSKLHKRMFESWRLYYSRGKTGDCDDTFINLTGDRREIVNLFPATYRRLVQDRISLVMQMPPEAEPIAINTDPESQAQCALVRGILDHYNREIHLEEQGLERFEMASVLGAGFQHVRWDPELGAGAMPDESGGTVYEGDLTASVCSPYQVAFDSTGPDPRRPRWWLVDEPMNRFDLMAKYGEDEGVAAVLRTAAPWSDRETEMGWDHDRQNYKFDDCVCGTWLYAERSPSLPNGRKTLICDTAILLDGPLDEDRAGVFPLYPNRVMFRPAEWHSNHFGGMPIADAIGKQLSTILSNHAAFGLQRMKAEKECQVATVQVDTGLSVTEFNAYDSQNRKLNGPEPMDALKSPPELFTLLDVLQGLQDFAQGGSPVTRGDPNATKGDSGSKAAMLYAAAQQIAAGDVRAKMRSDEEIYNFIVSSLRRHATVDRLVMIAGKNNSYTAKRFKGEDLDKIIKVKVRQPNPSRDSFAGRVQTVELIRDAKTDDERQRIQGMLETGKIDVYNEDAEAHRILIERENEAIRDPLAPEPTVLKIDRHVEHIAGHLAEGCNPEVRGQPEVQARLDRHIAWHMESLMPTSPKFAGTELLLVTGQKPLPDPRDMGAPGGQPGQPGKPQPGGNGAPPKPPAQPGSGEMPRKPQMPKNPATGERMAPPGGAEAPEPVNALP